MENRKCLENKWQGIYLFFIYFLFIIPKKRVSFAIYLNQFIDIQVQSIYLSIYLFIFMHVCSYLSMSFIH